MPNATTPSSDALANRGKRDFDKNVLHKNKVKLPSKPPVFTAKAKAGAVKATPVVAKKTKPTHPATGVGDGVVAAAATLVGVSPTQLGAAEKLLKTNPSDLVVDGKIKFDAVRELISTVGKTGLLNDLDARKATLVADSLGSNDWLAAAAHTVGSDVDAVKGLLSPASSIENRVSSALKLVANRDVSASTIREIGDASSKGHYAEALKLAAGASGDETLSRASNAIELFQDIFDTAKNGKSTANDWIHLAQRGALAMNADEGVQSLLEKAPTLLNAYNKATGGGQKANALGATADLTRALVPGATGELAGNLLDAASSGSSKSLDLKTNGALLASALGADETTANAVRDGIKLIESGGSVANVAGSVASIGTALGAPPVLGNTASVVQGVATGGVSGYAMAGNALGQIIGGETGKFVSKVSGYVGNMVMGPVGWALNVFNLIGDIFGGGQPPRMAKVPTQNTGFVGAGTDGAPSLYSVTQNGGERGMQVKVQQLNAEAVEKPNAVRTVIENRGDVVSPNDAGGGVLLQGEWMYARGDANADFRCGVDVKLGFVEQKKKKTFVADPTGDVPAENRPGFLGIGGYSRPRGRYEVTWETTWRAECNPPQGSFVEVNQTTGKLEIFAPSQSVVPRERGAQPSATTSDGDMARSENAYTKIWESDRGAPAKAGKVTAFHIPNGGGIQTAWLDPDGTKPEWKKAEFTAAHDGGFMGIGAYHRAADGGRMVSARGSTDFVTSGNYGYFDSANQLMQLQQRGALTDIVFQAEGGKQHVLYNKGANQFDELTADEYVERVAEEERNATDRASQASTKEGDQRRIA
jgi:hypothetical protein